MTFAPHQPSPLSRTPSLFKDPRTPPTTPGKTAKIWDEYEKQAVENARRREGQSRGSQPQRASASDIPRSSATVIASARSSFDFKFKSRLSASSSSTVAICKSCKQPITYASGICELCKKSVVLSPSGEATPPLSPLSRKFVSSDLQELHRKLSRSDNTTPHITSPTRKSFCPMPSQMLDPPIRLSSLRPPPGQEPIVEANRSRKTSLTDPNEPFLRLQIVPTTYQPRAGSHPASPTYPPTTPPSTSHSRASTRPSSAANTVSPLSPAVHIPTHPYARHNSATPSELSSLYPHTSRITSVGTGYGLQHATSAWDDWDSDGEGEKAGLVGLMKSIGKTKKKERGDSMESASASLHSAREEERKKSRDTARHSEESEVKEVKKKKRPSGFVRAISCGACRED
ncbi:hypothetical protein HBI56_011680 [Parastagonospora nodorum]|uniref:Uncharacterized protein n=1 Tax=Phaeosphaeria nodorum (strain SN15 / ATCC MYA-4574 / FGSC 10173) TaxID=321614 RepID=A0A7U2EPR7_PHANO|nr:hypothetical protein HBH56_009900 [Parastagonospora nodorum]QRC90700.1 hypothetical protein JI435_002210 [Parastagonospora nodorum SN15]KAH3934771.1 hypothetical protein HBH54_043200 [Parastagonospora nodorum]KAH3987032.1 hypothetical protein HBH51_013410 [Parastagonospora nodorum]KAH4001001.1 hypothetical protein HBI10_093650 [Parastagonospora nodorum]